MQTAAYTVDFGKKSSLTVAAGCMVKNPRMVTNTYWTKREVFARRALELWTAEEDNMIRTDKHTIKEMAALIGRSEKAIQVRRSALKCGRASNAPETNFMVLKAKRVMAE